MARLASDVVALDQAVEVVTRLTRIEPARELHAAYGRRMELDAGAVELAPQEAVIEAHVVRDEDTASKPLVQIRGEIGESWRLRQHVRRDAAERLDLRGQRTPGIDQRRPFRHHLEALDLDDADLGDAVGARARASRFEIDDGERRLEEVHLVRWMYIQYAKPSTRPSTRGPAAP